LPNAAASKEVKQQPPKKKLSQENIPKPPIAKRGLQQSDMFMAAFDDVEKKPAPKKLKVNKIVKVLQPDVPERSPPTVSATESSNVSHEMGFFD
jgi:hypothetical protein